MQAIVDADLVTTAVLADNFPKIAGNLAKGLKARLEAGKTKINVIPCENALLCGDMLKKEIIATGLITEAEVDQIAAIPNTAVDRMVFGTQRDDRDGIEAGKDHELAVEVNKLVNQKNCQSKEQNIQITFRNILKESYIRLTVVMHGQAMLLMSWDMKLFRTISQMKKM